jgi:hypothetical protein
VVVMGHPAIVKYSREEYDLKKYNWNSWLLFCNVLYSISFLFLLGYISIVSKNVLAETTIIL